jgi:hypothetical protein
MLWVIEIHQKENGDTEYAKAGFISLGLTIANIVLIIIASMLMFRLKEVRFNCAVVLDLNLYCVINHPSFFSYYLHELFSHKLLNLFYFS